MIYDGTRQSKSKQQEERTASGKKMSSGICDRIRKDIGINFPSIQSNSFQLGFLHVLRIGKTRYGIIHSFIRQELLPFSSHDF